MAPAYVIAREADPNPGWWSVAALSIAAVVATMAGHRAGSWFESRYPEPTGSGRRSDPRSVREATSFAAIGCGMATNGVWGAVLPSWSRTVFVLALVVLLAALVVQMFAQRRRASAQ